MHNLYCLINHFNVSHTLTDVEILPLEWH